MSTLKMLKKVYDKLGNDHIRSAMFTTAEQLGIRKDIIRMDTNGYCNIRCIMCKKMVNGGNKQVMSLEDFKKILDIFAPSTRMLYLSCAYEPLATPGFIEYLKYAKSKGIPHISFCTNALLLREDIISCLVDYEIDEIIISFNGLGKEDYNRIMKGSNYDRVCANIKALKDYKQKKNALKPHVRLNSILLKSNLLNFDNLYHFMSTNNIDTIQFRELMIQEDPNNPLEVEKELISNLSKEEYEEIVLKIKDMTQQLQTIGKEVILPSAFLEYTPAEPDLTIDSQDDIDIHKKQESSTCPQADISICKKQNIRKHSCSIPCFSYWIDRTGGVRVCGFDDKAILGNALDQDFKFLKARRGAFQKMALSGECSSELCTINIDSSTIV